MADTVPDWFVRLWFGDDCLVSYGILPPEKPAQAIERISRQRRRYEARKAATARF